MAATTCFLCFCLCIAGLSSLALAQNRTTTESVSLNSLVYRNASKTPAPSTVLITSTPRADTVKVITIVTQAGYQNTTPSSFETPEPTANTPVLFATPADAPTSAPTSNPKLQNAAPPVNFDVLPILGSALALLAGLCVIR